MVNGSLAEGIVEVKWWSRIEACWGCVMRCNVISTKRVDGGTIQDSLSLCTQMLDLVYKKKVDWVLLG